MKQKLVNIEEDFLFHGTSSDKLESIKKSGLLVSKTEKRRVDFLCGTGSVESAVFWAQAIAGNDQLGKAAIVVVNRDEAISNLKDKLIPVSGRTVTLVRNGNPIDIPPTLKSFRVIGPLTPEEITEITDFEKNPPTSEEIEEIKKRFGEGPVAKKINKLIALLREERKLFEKINTSLSSP